MTLCTDNVFRTFLGRTWAVFMVHIRRFLYVYKKRFLDISIWTFLERDLNAQKHLEKCPMITGIWKREMKYKTQAARSYFLIKKNVNLLILIVPNASSTVGICWIKIF